MDRRGYEERLEAHFFISVTPLQSAASGGPLFLSLGLFANWQGPFRVKLGSGEPLAESPLCTGGLNRSTQHFILEGKDGVWDGTTIS